MLFCSVNPANVNHARVLVLAQWQSPGCPDAFFAVQILFVNLIMGLFVSLEQEQAPQARDRM
jgi:hypothetical protein